MKLHTHKFAFAAASSMALLYIVCATLVMLWPTQALQLTASWLHLSTLKQVAPYIQVTFANATSGTIQSFVYTYLYAWLLAWIYNQLITKK
ncbi:MAG TPA: hypothetical protein ENI08_02120 [Candidatus Dependentiae bacterium]|nr:hypothetical protein [Candidatus Dependentiae bacterium]